MYQKAALTQNPQNHLLKMILFTPNLILKLDYLMVNLLKSLFYWLIKGCLKIQNDFCPSCGSNSLRNNGTIYNVKQKNECKKCGH